MNKKNIITIAAIAVAGVATYFVRKKIAERADDNKEPAAGNGNRHLTNAFSKAKALGQSATP